MPATRARVTDTQSVLAFQDCPDVFSLNDMCKALIAQGVPETLPGNLGKTAEYAADRLIRRLKKQGRIILQGRVWAKVKDEHPVVLDQRAS
jgi:hypothetical protein